MIEAVVGVTGAPLELPLLLQDGCVVERHSWLVHFGVVGAVV